jgi:hypothetical protein
MQTRTLILLAVAVVAALAATMLLERKSEPDSVVAGGGLLYPNLTANLNTIDRLELTQGDQQIVLEKSDSGWIVEQKSGYPADSGKIRQLLLRLSEARILEAKTTNPELYPRLTVAEPDAAEGAGNLLEIAAPSDVRLIIGDLDSRAGGTYVRRAGESQSYLVDTEIDAGGTPLDWLDRTIMDIDSASVSQVRISHADGETLTLLRVGGQLVVAGVPEDRELSGPASTQPAARLLSPLRLDDVVPIGEFDIADPEATVDVHLDDGRKITIRAWRREDERWMAFDVALAPPDEAEPTASGLPAESETGEEDDDSGDELETGRADPEAVAERDAFLAGWVYRVPVFKYDQAVRRMEDLLKPVTD